MALAPSIISKIGPHNRLRTAHIGVGGMGGEDLKAISSHPLVDVSALCDVDSTRLAAAKKCIQMPRSFPIIG